MKTGLSLKEHSASLAILLRGLDLTCIVASGLISFWVRFEHIEVPLIYKNVLVLGVLICAISLSFLGAYRAWRGASFTSEIQCVFSATTTTFIILILSAFVTQSSELFSRIWVMTWLISSTASILIYRYLLRKTLGIMRSKGFNIRRIIIIGDGELGQEVASKLILSPEFGMAIQGFITDKPEKYKKALVKDIPILGSIDDIDNIVAKHQADQVWIALPLSEANRMEKVQIALSTSPVTIRMVPDIFGFQLLNHSLTEVAGLPVINLSASHMFEGKNRFLKEIEDKILASIILLLITPILIGLAIAVKSTSRGPILFKQYRSGANGRTFKVYKFRSMVVHQEDEGVITQATMGDTRITKIGAFMRRTSLDELPQFINVLQGRMSIVGPRPHALAHNKHYKTIVESYMRRHMVKPGITGWAQVNGLRGETDTVDKMEARVKYDMYYIENWSLWLDLKIIFLTVLKGFIHKNAI